MAFASTISVALRAGGVALVGAVGVVGVVVLVVLCIYWAVGVGGTCKGLLLVQGTLLVVLGGGCRILRK